MTHRTVMFCLVILTCFFVDFTQIHMLFFYTSKNITKSSFFQISPLQMPTFSKIPSFYVIFLHIFTFLSFLVNASKMPSQKSIFHPPNATVRSYAHIMSPHIHHAYYAWNIMPDIFLRVATAFFGRFANRPFNIIFLFLKEEQDPAYFSLKKVKKESRRYVGPDDFLP